MAAAKWSHVSTENTNFARLCKLLIDGGTHALKEVLDNIHPPNLLQNHIKAGTGNHAILKNLKTKKVIFKEQWDKLYPTGGSTVDSSSFDITLLCLLLRNICHLKKPAGGWDKEPLPTSITIEDDITRIKIYRNKLYGHITKPALSDSDFEKYWDDIASVIARLEAVHYQAKVDKLKYVSMDPEGENYYIQCLEEWKNNDEKRLKELEENVDDNKRKLDEIGERVKRMKSTEQPKASESKFQDPLVYSQNLKCAMKNQLENYQECNLSPIIKEMKIEDIFTNLLIKQKEVEKSATPELKGRGGIILGVEGNVNPKSILIDGKPGIGKSLFCRKLVYEWTQDDIFDTTASSHHPEIRFTFLLTFRQLNMLPEKAELNLKDLLNLCSMLDGRTQIKDDSLIEHIIQHPEHLLIVLDGYDEYKDCSKIVDDSEKSIPNDPKFKMPVTALVSKLMKKKILRDSIVMVTSRIGEADEIVKHVHFDRHVQIAGFSEEQVIEYVGKYFKANEELKIKALASIKDNQDYLSFGCVPLTCFLMCLYMEWHIPNSREGFPKSLTVFYSDVLQYIERNYNKALKADQLDDSTAALQVQIIRDKLSELAASLTVYKQYSFDEDDLKKLNLTKKELSYIKSSSLLFCEAGVRKSAFSEIQRQYSFIHTTVQEYFAARYFVLKNEIPAQNSVSSMVLQFMAGSMEAGKHSKLMEKLLESIVGTRVEQRRVSLNCLYEYGDRGFVKGILKQNKLNKYVYSNGWIRLINVDYKVVIMLVDTLTTLNQEQSGPSASSVAHSLQISSSPSFRLGVETLCNSLCKESCTINELELYECNIDDEGAQCLSQCLSKLNKLNLCVTKLTDKYLVSIAPHCKHLTHLEISSTYAITDIGLMAIAQYCNNLIDLNMDNNKITGVSLEAIEPQYTELTHLKLFNNEITDKGVLPILRCCGKLTDLDLSGNKITDEGLKSIAPYCNNLTHLHMKINMITDDGLVFIAPYCKNLTYLNMRSQITYEDLPYCNNLVQDPVLLNGDHKKISDEGLISIIRCCDKLTYLELSNNDITDNGIESVLHILTHRDEFSLDVSDNKITDKCKERVYEVFEDKIDIQFYM